MNGDTLKLVRMAIKNDMSYLSVVRNYWTRIGKNSIYPPAEKLSVGVQKCNIERCSRLSQVMALYRTKHLRWMSTIFIAELLSAFEEPDMNQTQPRNNDYHT